MGRTVLIVDDHPSFSRAARALLEAESYEVVGEARDCASALRMARTLQPDVILLDVELPDGNAFGIAAALADGGRCRVVFVSTRDRDDYGALVEGSGAAGFIAKAELSGRALDALVR